MNPEPILNSSTEPAPVKNANSFSRTLAIIVPCYNEEEVLPTSAKILRGILQELIDRKMVSDESYLCFVNDGSRDRTLNIMEELHNNDPVHVKGISFSRNFGHQSALMAALHTLQADLYISIDADLQDDERAIVEMVEKANNGMDIVYGVRRQRTTDTFFKRFSALGFYKVMNFLGTPSIYNHADYRLMSRRAVEALRSYGESNVFLRGIVAELGFPSDKVFYDRKARELGESKYPLRKMIKFAWTGITSFSDKPLKLAIYLGSITFILSVVLIGYCMVCWMCGRVIPGWTSTIMLVTFFAGLNMFLLGVIGEYIGKIFEEVKRRPLYIIEETFPKNRNSSH